MILFDFSFCFYFWKQIIGDAAKERERKRDNKAKLEAQQAAEARRKAEEEELKRSLETVMKRDVKSGMVWNSTTREYQYLPDHTEESWRD